MSMRTVQAIFIRLFTVTLLGGCLHDASAQALFNPDTLMDGPDRDKIIFVSVNGKTAGGENVPANAGSGFFISPEGFALTAAHLFYRSRDITKPEGRLTGAATGQDFIQGRLGSASESPKTFQLVKLFPESDVALIQLLDPSKKTAFFKLCSEKPSYVDQLYGFGFTAGLVLSPQPGTLGGALLNDRYPVSMAINPGMSGGPIISRSGKVFAMAVSGVREPDYERFNFVRSVQFIHPVLEMAKTKEECDANPARLADQPLKPSSADESTKSAKRLVVYIDYTGEPDDVLLNNYRDYLLEEFFRLVTDTNILPAFSPGYNRIEPLEKIFKEYFTKVPNVTDVRQSLADYQQSILPAGAEAYMLVYFLKLQKLPATVAGSDLMIKATPRLLDVQFGAGNPTIVKDRPLRAEQVMLQGVYAESARQHAQQLTPQLARVADFSRDVVFIDCVDFQVFEANRPVWGSSALSDLKQQLVQKWANPPRPEFQSYKGRKLREARATGCNKKVWLPKDNINDNDSYIFTLARETIQPTVDEINKVFRAGWKKKKIAAENERIFEPMALDGEGSSIANSGPFLKVWVQRMSGPELLED
jgi:hypothetical protein